MLRRDDRGENSPACLLKRVDFCFYSRLVFNFN